MLPGATRNKLPALQYVTYMIAALDADTHVGSDMNHTNHSYLIQFLLSLVLLIIILFLNQSALIPMNSPRPFSTMNRDKKLHANLLLKIYQEISELLFSNYFQYHG